MSDWLQSPTSGPHELVPGAAESHGTNLGVGVPFSSVDPGLNSGIEGRENEHPPIDDLEQEWAAARSAADRLWSDLQRGGMPGEEDIAAIKSYASTLSAAGRSVGLNGQPSLSAVSGRVRETQLMHSLRDLRGPDDLAPAIDELREIAVSAIGQIAARLERFVYLVLEPDPHLKISLARELRSTPGPPTANLIDAAIAGLLSIVGAQPTPGKDSPPSDVAVIEQVTEEEVTDALAENVEAGRFRLAHELAMANGEDYRAAILAEAALCHNSSTPTFELLHSAQVPIDSEDLGSMVLHVASLLRVAFFDPSPGTLALIAHVIPVLEPFPALSVLAGVAIETLSQDRDASDTVEPPKMTKATQEAADIATWAKEVLERLRRQSRIFQGHRVWNDAAASDSPIGKILSIVSNNDAAQLDEVRQLCEPLLEREGIEREIEQGDLLRRSWIGRPRPMTESDRNFLIQQVETIIRHATDWCDAQTTDLERDPLSELRERIVVSARILMPQIAAELDYVAGDPWLEALAQAAKKSIFTTMDLVKGGGEGRLDLDTLEEVEIDPPLAVVAPFEIDPPLAVVAPFEIDPPLAVVAPFEIDLSPSTASAPSEGFNSVEEEQIEEFNEEPSADAFDPAEMRFDVVAPLAEDMNGARVQSSLELSEGEMDGEQLSSPLSPEREVDDEPPEDELENEEDGRPEQSVQYFAVDPENGGDYFAPTPRSEPLEEYSQSAEEESPAHAEVASLEVIELGIEDEVVELTNGPGELPDEELPEDDLPDDADRSEAEQVELDATTDESESGDEWLDELRTKLEQDEPVSPRRRFARGRHQTRQPN